MLRAGGWRCERGPGRSAGGRGTTARGRADALRQRQVGEARAARSGQALQGCAGGGGGVEFGMAGQGAPVSGPSAAVALPAVVRGACRRVSRGTGRRCAGGGTRRDPRRPSAPARACAGAGGGLPAAVASVPRGLVPAPKKRELLPRTSTPVSVYPIEPEADALGRYLHSLERFDALDAATRVLPSHGLPFSGVHGRVRQLREHHAERLVAVLQPDLTAACRCWTGCGMPSRRRIAGNSGGTWKTLPSRQAQRSPRAG